MYMPANTSLLLFLLLSLISCKSSPSSNIGQAQRIYDTEEVIPAFHKLLDSSQLAGSILVYDPSKHVYYSNDFEWARQGQLPASTFKIPNSIIALELGIIENGEVIIPWDGTTRSIEHWNQDLSLQEAFAYSCVPCYQSFAREVGPERMRRFISKLGYPGVSFQDEEIDLFWLQGESRINQFEQIEFLKRFRENMLPISAETSMVMHNIMVIDSTDSYLLSGKTGWSTSNEKDNGWFVGFAERGEQVLYFATNIEPKEETSQEAFIKGRRGLTEAAIKRIASPTNSN